MVTILADSLVPIFVGLLLGYIAGLRKMVDNKNVKSLITFLMTYTLPCSLFVAIAMTPRQALLRQTRGAIALAIVYVVVFVATYYASRKLVRDTAGGSAVLALTIGFPNAAAVGIPLLTAVYGPQATVTVAVAIAIGAITVTPITLAILENGTSAGKSPSQRTSVWVSLWGALKKPVFWAPMLGVLIAATGVHMPPYLDKSLIIVGGATEGTALFVTGLIASAQRFRMDWSVGWAVVGKNLIQPALCLGVAPLLSTPLEEAKYAVLLSAVPAGFFGVLFGEGFGTESERASSSLIASTVLCIFTLTGWILVLDRMH